MNKRWMIYGAYGYSGELILREALKQGLKPIVAGRHETKTLTLAADCGLEARVFALDDQAKVREQLDGVGLVVHCAGPFSATSGPMVEACLHNRCHYLDITGEIDIFEKLHARAIDSRAKSSETVVCPGVGFDVVPTDCMAATLSSIIANATHLRLGFATKGRFSPGTAKTMIEGLAKGMRHRRNGTITKCPIKTRHIDFGDGTARLAMNLAWGDVSTAYYTTGIENIEVYIAAHRKMVRQSRLSGLIRPLLGLKFVQNRMKKKIERTIKGPSEAQRQADRTLIWGEILNDSGACVTGFMETPNGYTLTAMAPVAIVRQWLESGFTQCGSLTPARLMGKSFASSLPGCSQIRIER